MTGYKAVAHARPEPNRGSVIWVRESGLQKVGTAGTAGAGQITFGWTK